MVSVLAILTHLTLMMTLIHFSYEKMEAQKLPQGHPARKRQNQDLNLSRLF